MSIPLRIPSPSPTTMTLLLLVLLAFVMQPESVVASSSSSSAEETISSSLQRLRGSDQRRRVLQDEDEPEPSLSEPIECRLVTVEVSHVRDAPVEDRPEIRCVPIVDGYEQYPLLKVNVHADILHEYGKQLREGALRVWIYSTAPTAPQENKNIFLARTTRAIPSSSSSRPVLEMQSKADFEIVSVDDGRRRLQTNLGIPPNSPLPTDARTTRTFAVVRVHTTDARIITTDDEFRMGFEQEGGFIDQFSRCSNGQLQWEYVGTYDAQADRAFDTYDDSFDFATVAEQSLIAQGLITSNLLELAHNVICCIPLSPNGDEMYTGVAYYNFGISVIKNEWCLDLMTVAHEVGHNLGLYHAGFGGYSRGDLAGYMSDTIIPPQANGPGKCFDAINHERLQWFEQNTLNFNPEEVGTSKFNLVAFIETSKLEETDTDPIVLIANGALRSYYFQYNLAQSYNNGTELSIDEIQITYQDQFEDSVLVGSVARSMTLEIPQYQGSGTPSLFVRFCRAIFGRFFTAQVGIGFENDNTALCGQTTFRVIRTMNDNNNDVNDNRIDGAAAQAGAAAVVMPRRCTDSSRRGVRFDRGDRNVTRRCTWFDKADQRIRKRRYCDATNFRRTIRPVFQQCQEPCAEWMQCVPNDEYELLEALMP